MLKVVQERESRVRKLGGKRPTLTVHDKLLITLEYWREYRTYLKIGLSWGISESYAFKIIKATENALIKHPDFSLPGRKSLRTSDMQYEVVLIDATETPIERPQKNKNGTTRARKSDTRSRAK
jgi:hypothetical protein